MKRGIITALISMLLFGMFCTITEAKCPKKVGVFKNYGQRRSAAQKAINLLHPKGQARASAQHAIKVMSKAYK